MALRMARRQGDMLVLCMTRGCLELKPRCAKDRRRPLLIVSAPRITDTRQHPGVFSDGEHSVSADSRKPTASFNRNIADGGPTSNDAHGNIVSSGLYRLM